MCRSSRRPWITSVLGSMALFALGLACSSPGEQPITAQQDPSPAPNLGANVVQHRRGEIAPKVEWRSSAIERAPMSLTAGDGSGLRLLSITGTVVIEDPLAFTELRLTFENPEPRRIEGRFEFDLPTGAALSRLAMRIGETWMEGEVVERTKGHATFESFIHERPKVDPALLEKAAANRVSARVFPIQPRERKEIVVSYSQPLVGGDSKYRLPLQGLPELDALDLRVIVKTVGAERAERFPTASQRVIEVRERDFAPSKDLVVALEGAGDAAALRAGELVAVRVRPRPLEESDAVDSLTVLFDTSASTAHGFDAEVDRLGAMLAALGEVPVRIVAFDQTVEIAYEGPANAALGDPLAGLRERRAFGASDLHAALSHDAVRSAKSRRLLLWSDGIVTAGELQRTALAEAAKAIDVERIDAYATSASTDREILSALTSASQSAGFVVGPDLEGPALAEALTSVGFAAVEVGVTGAQWSYPPTLDGFAPGDDVVVYAAFKAGAPEDIRVEFSDSRLPDHVVPTLEGAMPLLERAVARARTDQLQATLEQTSDPEEATKLRKRLIGLAVDHRILTQHTALLVLESEAEFRRYGIDRSALADILTIGPGGVEQLRRGNGPTARALPPVGDLLADAREPSDAIPQLGRNFDPDLQARAAGILGETRGVDDGTRHAGEEGFMGRSERKLGNAFAFGNDDEDVWGGLTGTEVGEAFGAGGLGLLQQESGHFLASPYGAAFAAGDDEAGGIGHRSPFASVGGLGLSGTGRGGGGTGEGTIGLGNVGLIGKGGGGGTTGTGSGYGRGAGAGFGGRGKRIPQVRAAKATVSGALDKDIVRRIVRSHINEVRHCYNRGLVRDPNLNGRVSVAFSIAPTGNVVAATGEGPTTPLDEVAACIGKAALRWRFPAPAGGGIVRVTTPFVLDSDGATTGWTSPSAVARPPRRRAQRRRPGDPTDGPQWNGSAQSGRFATLQTLVAAGRPEDARADAWEWATTEPDNALALIALGEMLELDNRPALAARVYGSLIDLHPHRPDMRRSAASRIEALGDTARPLAIDSYRKAVEQRPDQINGHRLLAWALVKAGQHAEAFDVLTTAIATPIPAGRFNGVKTLLAEDRELVAAAWLASAGTEERSVRARLSAAAVRPATTRSLRLVADWETDATDVDILVDPLGRGDGRRHADVRSGYGPEAWIARGAKRPDAVTARVRYFNRGAMGLAMGVVSSIAHDGAGQLTFSDRPFVLMEASGSVELGRFRA